MKLRSAVIRHGLADRRAVQGPRVDALQRDDLGVLLKLGVELAAADIDGIDLGGALGDEDVSEAAGRGAEIEATLPSGSKPKASSAA